MCFYFPPVPWGLCSSSPRLSSAALRKSLGWGEESHCGAWSSQRALGSGWEWLEMQTNFSHSGLWITRQNVSSQGRPYPGSILKHAGLRQLLAVVGLLWTQSPQAQAITNLSLHGPYVLQSLIRRKEVSRATYSKFCPLAVLRTPSLTHLWL